MVRPIDLQDNFSKTSMAEKLAEQHKQQALQERQEVQSRETDTHLDNTKRTTEAEENRRSDKDRQSEKRFLRKRKKKNSASDDLVAEQDDDPNSVDLKA